MRDPALPRAPWQNPYAERLIGSLCSECLDHVVILNARGLRRVLNAYVDYYLKSRTHLSLDKDVPVSRPVAALADGSIVAVPQLRWVAPPLRTTRGIARKRDALSGSCQTAAGCRLVCVISA